MNEPGQRINPSADLPIRFQCGCVVVFLGSCFHRSSRMTCCVKHAGRDALDERNRMVDDARRELRFMEMGQPPR